MRVFHKTGNVTVTTIINEGFQDGDGKYISDFAWRGVWVSDRAVASDRTPDDVFLAIEIPDEVFAKYEWTRDGGGERGSLIPAKVLNRYGRPEPWLESDVPATSG